MIIAGSTKTLAAAVHVQSTGAQVATGTIYAVVQLEQPGNADDGKYWDTNAGGSWQASPVSWPTASHTQAAMWAYALPAGATTGRDGAITHYTMTDNLTEASATTVCGGGEHRVVADIPSTAGIADAVWDEQWAGHQDAGSMGQAALYIADPLLYEDIAAAVWNDSLADNTTAGTAGKQLSDLAERDYDYIAMAVWDEPISGHLDAGTTGASLSGATAPSAADVADAVWDEAIADHLTAGTTGSALNTASPSTGSSMVTITVQTGSLVPVPGVSVSIFDATNTALQITGATDPSGKLTVALDDATYKVRLVKAGYTFTAPETMVVSGTTTDTFTATAWAPSAPSAVDLCVVYGWIANGSGVALPDVRLRARVVTPDDQAGLQLTDAIISATTSALGYFEMELVRGATVRLHCAEAGIDYDRVVPNAESQDISDWDA